MQKNILVTGCSSGIGLYTAIELKKSGCAVVGTVRKVSDGRRLREHGIPVVVMDLSDEESIREAFKAAMVYLGHYIDCLFNNAAYGQCGAVEDLPTEALRRQFEVNFFGWHTLTRLALKEMRTQNNGMIIQNSSVLGLAAMPYRGAYNASKFAIEGYTDTLRLELENTKIKVVLIEPGPIETKFRATCLKHLKSHIDIENSFHTKQYRKQIERLEEKKLIIRSVHGPESVFEKVFIALNAKKPKARYYVTSQTRFIAIAKRLLPQAFLDKILLAADKKK